MARGVNKVLLIGRLGKDPETRFLSNGNGVTTFSIATSEQWTDKQTGQKQERTEWHRIQAWGKLSEICSQYLRKGSQVFIEGSLTTREWEDQQGVKRYSTEIKASSMQMLGSDTPPERRQPAHTQGSGHQSSEAAKEFYAPQAAPTQGPQGADMWDSDIPF